MHQVRIHSSKLTIRHLHHTMLDNLSLVKMADQPTCTINVVGLSTVTHFHHLIPLKCSINPTNRRLPSPCIRDPRMYTSNLRHRLISMLLHRSTHSSKDRGHLPYQASSPLLRSQLRNLLTYPLLRRLLGQPSQQLVRLLPLGQLLLTRRRHQSPSIAILKLIVPRKRRHGLETQPYPRAIRIQGLL